MKRLAILGASGHGKVVADAAEACGWRSVVFFDDAWPEHLNNGPWAVLGDTEALLSDLTAFDGVVVGIGCNRIRAIKQRQLMSAGANVASIIHPTAIVSPYAKVGKGSVVLASAVINVCAEVGEGAIINTGSVVEHDCELGDFIHLSPNATLAGGVKVGELSWVGAGACVRQMLDVGEYALVGMGAVVTRNVPSRTTVIGNPAKLITVHSP